MLCRNGFFQDDLSKASVSLCMHRLNQGFPEYQRLCRHSPRQDRCGSPQALPGRLGLYRVILSMLMFSVWLHPDTPVPVTAYDVETLELMTMPAVVSTPGPSYSWPHHRRLRMSGWFTFFYPGKALEVRPDALYEE